MIKGEKMKTITKNDFRDLWKIFKKLDDEQALASWLLRQSLYFRDEEQNKIYNAISKYNNEVEKMRFTKHELKLLMEALAGYNKVISNSKKGNIVLLIAKQKQITNLYKKIEINVFGGKNERN